MVDAEAGESRDDPSDPRGESSHVLGWVVAQVIATDPQGAKVAGLPGVTELIPSHLGGQIRN